MRILAVLLLPALTLAPRAAGGGEAPLDLVPRPRNVAIGHGHAVLSAEWSIVLSDSAADHDAAVLLAREVRDRYGWKWPIRATPTRGPQVALAPTALPSRTRHPRQSYQLTIRPSLITVAAPTAQGRFYGVQTLRQLVRAGRGPGLPCLTMLDSPAMEWRGVSDDISRGQMSTLADFQARLEHLAYYKINLYGLYIEDVITTAPDGRRGITRGELAQLAREARRLHITLFPIFQSLGYNPLIVARLESQPLRPLMPLLGAFASARRSPFDPWATRAILGLIDSLAGAVPSPWFNVGGDELGTFGLVRPAAAGIATDGSTHLAYVNFLADHLHRDYQRRTLVYGDFVLKFPAVAQGLDRSVIVVDWNYYPHQTYPSALRLRQAGFRNLIVSPGLWSWSTFYPNYARALPNVAAFIDTGKSVGAIGAITSAWGDNGTESLRENNRLGYAYGAAASWETRAPEARAFTDRFAATEYGARARGLAEAEWLIGHQDFPELDYTGRVFHRLPRVRPLGADWQARMLALRSEMDRAIAVLDRLQDAAQQNRGHLDALRHAAKRYVYLADRDLAMGRIAATLRNGMGEEGQRTSLRELTDIRKELAALMDEYQILWLRRNKVSGLSWNMDRLTRQRNELDAMISAASAGKLRPWAPGVRPLSEKVTQAARGRTSRLYFLPFPITARLSSRN